MLDFNQNLMESWMNFLPTFKNKKKLSKIWEKKQTNKQTPAEIYIKAPKICLILLKI